MIREGIAKLVERNDLIPSEAEEIMSEIMSGSATNAQIAAFLTALRMKGETIDNIATLASVMRRFSHQIHPKVSGTLVDTCGTGGDTIKTFNISTTAAFITSGADIPVAKHGNRSVTSLCGSADVLEALGFNLQMLPALVEKSIEEVGIGFMFAPIFHPAMKYAVTPRNEIGIRTIFNILGPLTNPANAKAQLLGVYTSNLTEPLAHVLNRLGVEHAMIVHGEDGLDEISTIGKTKITHLKQGEISTYYINPKDIGVKTVEKRRLERSTLEESVRITFRILNGKENLGKEDPYHNIVLANAAAAIHLGGKSDSIREGIDVAQESIENGSAYLKLKHLIQFSEGDMSKLEELENHE